MHLLPYEILTRPFSLEILSPNNKSLSHGRYYLLQWTCHLRETEFPVRKASWGTIRFNYCFIVKAANYRYIKKMKTCVLNKELTLTTCALICAFSDCISFSSKIFSSCKAFWPKEENIASYNMHPTNCCAFSQKLFSISQCRKIRWGIVRYPHW